MDRNGGGVAGCGAAVRGLGRARGKANMANISTNLAVPAKLMTTKSLEFFSRYRGID
jgi:hypothetical protein